MWHMLPETEKIIFRQTRPQRTIKGVIIILTIMHAKQSIACSSFPEGVVNGNNVTYTGLIQGPQRVDNCAYVINEAQIYGPLLVSTNNNTTTTVTNNNFIFNTTGQGVGLTNSYSTLINNKEIYGVGGSVILTGAYSTLVNEAGAILATQQERGGPGENVYLGNISQTILNYGSIQSGNRPNIYVASTDAVIYNFGSINSLNIYDYTSDIRVDPNGSIASLTNGQGGDGNSATTKALTFYGKLPSIYKEVIRSTTHYGQLQSKYSFEDMSFNTYGDMTFTIDKSSLISPGRYVNVLQGFPSLGNITGVTGSFGGYNYTFVENAQRLGYWDLVFNSVRSDITLAGSPHAASGLGVSLNPVFAGGTLQMNQISSVYNQDFTVDRSLTNTIDQYGHTSTFNGIFSNASGQTGNLIIANSLAGGSVIFTGENSYTGRTTINTGATLQLGNGSLSGSVAGDIDNNGNLIFNRSNDMIYDGKITGSGSLTKLGIGSLILSGSNSYLGSTLVEAGSLVGNTKSLQGKIVNNSVVLFDQAINGTYAGEMSGTGSLAKSGMGLITLTGLNSYIGPTIIRDGILAINGSITSAVQVMSGAQLQGLGHFGGGIINNGGIVSPGNGIGTIYSTGNISFELGSFYRVDVNAAGQSDRIQVNGNVVINGGAVQVNAVSGNYRPTQKYTIIQANGNLLGRFDSVSTNSILLRPSLSYDERDAFLTLDRVTDSNGDIPFWQIAKTINQHNVARSLTVGARGPVSSQGLNVIDSILTGTGQSGQVVLDAVGGAGLAGVQTTAMEVGQMVSSTISDQIAYWRSGEINDVTGVTLHDSQIHDRSRSFMAYAPIENGVVVKNPIKLNGPAAGLLSSVPPVRTYRAWGSMFGGGANFLSDAGRGTPSATAGYYGGLLGVDYQLTPQALVGVSLGGSSSGFSVGSLSTTGNLTGFHAGLYGSYTMGASYIALNETFSNYSNKTNRSAGGYSFLPYESLSANFGSTEFRTRLEGGHSVVLGGLKATPFIAAEIAAYNVNGFSEKSSLLYQSSLALKNNGQTINSLPTFVGLRLSNAYTLANGWRLAPIGSVAYVHEFFPQRQFTNILMSIPSQEFNVAGPRSTYNLVQTKLGVMMNINKQFALFSDFQGEFSPMSQSYGGTAGFRYSW